MRREVAGGYELDDDRDRVDVDMVHRYLAEEAYWVPGRDRATIERLVRESTRVIGVYLGDEQIGFARVISDGTSVAWLGDVFVLAQHRGRGLGEELVREAVDHPEHRDLYWYLNTGSRRPAWGRWSAPNAADHPGRRSSGRSTSDGAWNGTVTSSTQSGCEAMSARAPMSPCRCPASAWTSRESSAGPGPSA
jgi:GNAT superfamily N-acetyltransferase